MSCIVEIRSVKDCRAVPLFPCICGDDGTVGAFGVERYFHRRTDVCFRTGCHLESIYEQVYIGCYPDEWCPEGEPHPHYDCICVGTRTVYDTCRYDDYNWEMGCVPMEFKRLGPKSRALVMSLYRAIVERFFIMRATGCDRNRPTCDLNFPFDSMLLKANTCADKLAFAGQNRRRAFGGTFRDTFRSLVYHYQGTASIEQKCGVVFYPRTPYVGGPADYASFIPCAREYTASDAISWWPPEGSCWANSWLRKIVTGADGYREAPWVIDNSMQIDLRCILSPQYRRPLLRAITSAFAAHMGSVACACRYMCHHQCDGIQDSKLDSWSRTPGNEIFRCCAIRSFNGMIGRFFPCRDTRKLFSLPALGLALRMLSALNAQTVSRERRATIPHKRITAKFTLPFGVANRQFVVGSEAYSFRMCCVNFACAVTCAYLSYEDGGAAFATEDVYYNLDDRQPPSETCCVEVEVPTYACVCVGTCYSPPYPHYGEVCIGCYGDPYPHYVHCYCDEFGPEGPDVPYWHDEPIYLGCFCDECSAYPHYRYDFLGCFCDPFSHYECRCVGTHTEICIRPNPGYTCVSIGCYSLWGTRAASTAPTTESDASVTFKAVWPDLSGADFAFGGKAYPARWAVEECDVAFGAVSAFVRGATSDKRAWVVNKTDRPKHTLGGCRDLMTVLGRGLMRAALKRTMEDQGGVRGNTFSGAQFPVSEGGIRLEMVGENHDSNIEMIRCYAEQENCTAGAASWLKYHHLKVNGNCIIGYVTADDTTGIQIAPSPEWYDGRWLLLATRGGGAISFDYRDDYNKCGDHGIVGTCMRHGWTLARTSMQFGGFFGTFIFNNRAARQT